MNEIKLAWSGGMDNVSSKTNLPDGYVVDALNGDIDRNGSWTRRKGPSPVGASNVHDIWESKARGESFAIVDGVLSKVNMLPSWASSPLYTISQDVPFSYTDLNGSVIASSRNDLLSIAADLTTRPLGVETPGVPSVTPAASGALDAGRRAVAISYLAGSEEGALSFASFATVAEGQGLLLTLPQPSEQSVTAIGIYCTPANGDLMYRVGTVPVGTASYALNVWQPGRKANNQYLDRMIPGDFVRHWHGRLWTVRGNVIRWSDSNRYGLTNQLKNFVMTGYPLTMFEPVEGGIFFGTRAGVFFLSGNGPNSFIAQRRGGLPPVAGSGRRAPAALFGDAGETGEYVATWFAANGFIVGRGDGSISEPQRRRFMVDNAYTSAATVIYGRRILASMH